MYVALHRSGQYLLTCFFEEAKTEVFRLRQDGHLGESACLVDSGMRIWGTLVGFVTLEDHTYSVFGSPFWPLIYEGAMPL